VAAVIGADPLLSEVRADQVTRIKAEPAALQDLPFVLQIPGIGADIDDSRWSEAMAEQHLDCSSSGEETCTAWCM
jgi:hypothetical protein